MKVQILGGQSQNDHVSHMHKRSLIYPNIYFNYLQLGVLIQYSSIYILSNWENWPSSVVAALFGTNFDEIFMKH